MATNTHHILWCRKKFLEGRYAKLLRQELTIEMDYHAHRELHKHCPQVPVPDELVCKILWEKLIKIDRRTDTLAIIYVLIQDINELGVSVAEEFSNALIAQVPFIFDQPP